MEILRLKGVPFSRLEVYKGRGGSSFIERGAMEIFSCGAGHHEFFPSVVKGSCHKYLFL